MYVCISGFAVDAFPLPCYVERCSHVVEFANVEGMVLGVVGRFVYPVNHVSAAAVEELRVGRKAFLVELCSHFEGAVAFGFQVDVASHGSVVAVEVGIGGNAQCLVPRSKPFPVF